MKRIDKAATLCDTTDLSSMQDLELLEAIRELESTYRSNLSSMSSTDHRRHLSRPELELVFNLAKRAARPRILKRRARTERHVAAVESNAVSKLAK